VEPYVRAGEKPILTVGSPGSHGKGVSGVHGIGVSTPPAAVVAAKTVGFVGQVHIPKDMMLRKGT